jgi:hypothetical protein
MARLIKRLTAKKVAEAGVGMFADGSNLWLKCSAGANGLNKSWVVRYCQIESKEERRERKAAGRRQKERQMGLGPYPQIDLTAARQLAADAWKPKTATGTRYGQSGPLRRLSLPGRRLRPSTRRLMTSLKMPSLNGVAPRTRPTGRPAWCNTPARSSAICPSMPSALLTCSPS